MIGLLLASTLLLAFVNGANDNMKGVATLYGSNVLSYRASLALATVATAVGCLASIVVSTGLVRAFSAKGLVPDEALTPAFLASVALGAALTVLVATVTGLPVSTTHALVGALAGAGWVAAGSGLNLMLLAPLFLLPLLAGPLLAVAVGSAGYRAGRWGRKRVGVEAETCLCVGQRWVPVASASGEAALTRQMSVQLGSATACQRRYQGNLAGVSAQTAVSAGHVASASLVGFARGLNDTPKILGLIVGASVLSPAAGAAAIAGAMAAGGLVAARPVTETLSRKITEMNPGQGLAGNLSTSLLVMVASRFGLPVSTTHVSAGSIFGIGSVTGSLRWRIIGAIAAAWLTTLPMAAVLAGAAMWVL